MSSPNPVAGGNPSNARDAINQGKITWKPIDIGQANNQVKLTGTFTTNQGTYTVTVRYHAKSLQSRQRDGASAQLEETIKNIVENIGTNELIKLVGITVQASLNNLQESQILKDKKKITWKDLQSDKDADFASIKSTVDKVIKAFETNFPNSQGGRAQPSAARSPADAGSQQPASGQNGSSPVPPAPAPENNSQQPPQHVSGRSSAAVPSSHEEGLTIEVVESDDEEDDEEDSRRLEIGVEEIEEREQAGSGSGSGRVQAREPDHHPSSSDSSEIVQRKDSKLNNSDDEARKTKLRNLLLNNEDFKNNNKRFRFDHNASRICDVLFPKLQKYINKGYNELSDKELEYIKEIRNLLLFLKDDALKEVIKLLGLDVDIEAHKPFIRDLIVKDGDIVSTLSQGQIGEEYTIGAEEVRAGRPACAHICAHFCVQNSGGAISSVKELEKIVREGVGKREAWNDRNPNKKVEGEAKKEYLDFLKDSLKRHLAPNEEFESLTLNVNLGNPQGKKGTFDNKALKPLFENLQEKSRENGGNAYVALTFAVKGNNNSTVVVYFPNGEATPVLFDSHGNSYRGISMGASHRRFNDIDELVTHLSNKYPEGFQYDAVEPMVSWS